MFDLVSLELIISMISMIAALGAAYSAWISARIAHRALSFSEEDAISKREYLKMDLINSLRWMQGGNEYVSFSCTYMNASSYPTTIKYVDLVVYGFNVTSNKESTLLLKPENVAPDGSDFLLLSLPLNLNARTTSSGWVSFTLPKSWINHYIIDRYELIGTTWSGHKTSIESHIVMKQV